MNGRFLTELNATPLPDGKIWRLRSRLVWLWDDGTREACALGMETDFASVPDLGFFAALVMALALLLMRIAILEFLHDAATALFWFAWLIALLAKRIDDDDRTDAPACFHDQDYTEQTKPRYVADWHLFIRMRANKVGRWKCWLYWLNLRLFGWVAWHFGKHCAMNRILLAPAGTVKQPALKK